MGKLLEVSCWVGIIGCVVREVDFGVSLEFRMIVREYFWDYYLCDEGGGSRIG